MSETSVLESPNAETDTADSKKGTRTKTVKKNIVGRRPGPKSKTFLPILLFERLVLQEEKHEEIKTEQADNKNIAVATKTDSLTELITNEDEKEELKYENPEHLIITSSVLDENNIAKQNRNEKIMAKCNSDNVEDCIQEKINVLDKIDNDLENWIDGMRIGDFDDSINLSLGDDDIKLFSDEEDTDIAKEDEVNEGLVEDETASSRNKSPEFQPPVTANSKSDTNKQTNNTVSGSNDTSTKPTAYKFRGRSDIEQLLDAKQSRRSHKGDKDGNNYKTNVGVEVNDETKDETKQVREKVSTDNKQSNNSKAQPPLNNLSKIDASTVQKVWVKNLSLDTKAADLKKLFLKYGKVVSAKILINTKTPVTQCYGFVKLSSAEEIDHIVKRLNQTKLNGQIVTIERANKEISYWQCTANADNSKKNNCAKESKRKCKKPEDRQEKKGEKRQSFTIDNSNKKTRDLKDRKRSLSKDTNQESKRSKIINNERGPLSRGRSDKSPSNDREKKQLEDLEILRRRVKIEQQELQRFIAVLNEQKRQKQKALREEEYWRRLDEERQIDIKRKQKMELKYLAKERQQLQIEREHIKKGKAKITSLERENQRLERKNQRLEREQLQREKEELQRALEQLKAAKIEVSLSESVTCDLDSSLTASGDKNLLSSSSQYIRNEQLNRSCNCSNEKSCQSKPSLPPLPLTASTSKDSAVSSRNGVPSSSDHRYTSRSYAMCHSNHNNVQLSLPPVNEPFGSSSGPRSMAPEVFNTSPWSSGEHSEIENVVWQHPPEPLLQNYRNNPPRELMSGNSVVYGHQVSVGMNIVARDDLNRYNTNSV